MSFSFFQATPHSRRETNDSFNDETFGSADTTSEDRAEEEKMRKGLFLLFTCGVSEVWFFDFIVWMFQCCWSDLSYLLH